MTARPPNALVGLLRLARGRADGIEQFGADPRAFVASLVPLAAFPLVGAAWLVLRGQVGDGLLSLFASSVALLAPPVLSHAVARAWGREAAWLRYAVAFNWSQWAIPLAGMALVVAMRVLSAAGLPPGAAGNGFVLGLAGYAMWLHWFVARHGLGLPAGRALGLSLLVNIGTLLLATVPHLIAGSAA